MEYIEKYNQIIYKLIKKSFPKLENKKIYFVEKEVPYRARVSYFPWGMRIIVSYKLREFDEKVVRRILIHELCHLEIFLSWGIIWTNLDYIWYSISKTHSKKVEGEANILMIKKENDVSSIVSI